MTFRLFFKGLTGFDPNPFQLRVADAILNEANVILRAPTGSGKTWAVVAPFLYSILNRNQIADRLLYALPLRSLATSLFRSTRAGVEKHSGLTHLTDRIRIQTGEYRDDDRFMGLATFTTIDQLLSSYLMQPVGLPRRCGNLNAGAMLGSLICFDEFHLLEPSKSMGTALEMLDALCLANPMSRFVLMTATLSTDTLRHLETMLKSKLIDVPPEEVEQLPMQQGKTRIYRWCDHPMKAEDIAHAHQQRRSIVVVNTVRESQRLYEELNSAQIRSILGPNTKVRLLHSRYFPEDRQRLESGLSSWFGPDATVMDVILIATQVIEAGLDFSCDNLHTELAPLNSLVQRAGRCARRQRESGTVRIYQLSLDRSGIPSYGPYRDDKAIVDATSDILATQLEPEGQMLKFHDELRLLDEVHTNSEMTQLRSFRLASRRSEIRRAMDGDDPGAVRRLIRDVDSINIVITDNPESIRFDRRQWPESLSIPSMSLFALFNSEYQTPVPWIAMAAREQDITEGGAIRVEWDKVETPMDILKAGWLLAIHPNCASYSPEFGLMIGRAAAAPPVRMRARPSAIRYSYEYETYDDHIHKVRAAGRRHEADNVVATRRLAQELQTTPEAVVEWLDLIWALHDVGKLAVAWQEAIWESQSRKPRRTPQPRPPLAHSDYDPATDPHDRRPPHAAEGAFAVARVLWSRLAFNASDCVAVTALSAITRHHGPHTSQLAHFTLIPDASGIVAKLISPPANLVELIDSPKPIECENFCTQLFSCADSTLDRYLALYCYFCRRLRLADQASFTEN